MAPTTIGAGVRASIRARVGTTVSERDTVPNLLSQTRQIGTIQHQFSSCCARAWTNSMRSRATQRRGLREPHFLHLLSSMPGRCCTKSHRCPQQFALTFSQVGAILIVPTREDAGKIHVSFSLISSPSFLLLRISSTGSTRLGWCGIGEAGVPFRMGEKLSVDQEFCE